MMSILQRRRGYISFINSMKPQRQTAPPPHHNAQKLLDIYIRNNKKQALLVHSPPRANLAHITNVIAARLRVPPEDQALFYNGQPLWFP